jgi:hypothetical protein
VEDAAGSGVICLGGAGPTPRCLGGNSSAPLGQGCPAPHDHVTSGITASARHRADSRQRRSAERLECDLQLRASTASGRPFRWRFRTAHFPDYRPTATARPPAPRGQHQRQPPRPPGKRARLIFPFYEGTGPKVPPPPSRNPPARRPAPFPLPPAPFLSPSGHRRSRTSASLVNRNPKSRAVTTVMPRSLATSQSSADFIQSAACAPATRYTATGSHTRMLATAT